MNGGVASEWSRRRPGCLSPLWPGRPKNLRLGMVANPSGPVGVGRSRPSPALGQVMRALREERGLGQEALARKAGVTQTTVSFIERRMVDPHWGTVERLGDVLGVSMAEIGTRVVIKEAAAKDC